jgi:uncharacterized protein YodC (DUF2158 family)
MRETGAMSQFEIGNIVVLTSGSMKMVVEAVDGDRVQTVWCHEGEIGRDSFHEKLLRVFEFRDDDDRPARAPRAAGPRAGGGKPFGGPREGAGKPYGDKPRRKPAEAAGDADDKPRVKTGWDGKPREKKFFRKD